MKKLLFIISTILLLAEFYKSSAQWVQVTNGIGNKAVNALAVNGTYIFAGTQLYGVYLSTNNGELWTQAGLSNQLIISSFAFIGNNIFAGTSGGSGNGIYRSTDNGASWTQSGLNNRDINSLIVIGNNIFAGTAANHGVYVSTNNGTNWTQTALNNRNVTSLAVNGNYIFAGTFDPSNLYGVYLSTNNGGTWTQTSLNNQNVYSLAVNGNNIFAGTGSPTYAGVFLSTNNGTSWAQTTLNNFEINELAVIGNNVFAGGYLNGVYVSTNNGTNWTQRNEGLGNVEIFSFCILNNYIFAGSGWQTPLGIWRRPLSELVGIQLLSNEIPEKFSLSQNYPNPFNPTTKIRFDIPPLEGDRGRIVRITIYDMLGTEITTLVNEKIKPGTYEVKWEGTDYSSGVYYYKLFAGDYSETKKMILLR